MTTPVETYYHNQLEAVKKALEANFFEASIHESLEAAEDFLIKNIVFSKPAQGEAPSGSPAPTSPNFVITGVDPSGPYSSVGFGGSATVASSNLLKKLRAVPNLEVIDRNDASLPPEVRSDLTRKSMLVDLFIASSNALTMDGKLVNIDKFGNRVAAITYGPKKVALFVGRNKIVADVHAGITRSKNIAAAMNALRLNVDTPCSKTAKCHDCKGSNRICGITVINDRSFPPGRIHVLLINQDLGF
ncbi:MAG: lactate utilization protein [Deltaproteobacteria bacterium]|jgi:hypothetical protein|nr:lactate utilization protein [Deltaproteobacteria bacterium]